MLKKLKKPKLKNQELKKLNKMIQKDKVNLNLNKNNIIIHQTISTLISIFLLNLINIIDKIFSFINDYII